MIDATIAATPRLAATVLLVRDDPFSVLIVERAAREIDAFSTALVFPGGVVDPGDRDEGWTGLIEGAPALAAEERVLRVAACRETFEEVGILIAARQPRSCPAPGSDFAALMRAAGLRLALDRLVRFGHWITPTTAARRFDTHFYLCPAPAGVEPVCDGRETVRLAWMAPGELYERAEAGAARVPFPTRMNLRRLAESGDVESALAAARARARFTVRPGTVRRGGTLVVTIPEEAGYGVTEDIRTV